VIQWIIIPIISVQSALEKHPPAEGLLK